MKYEIDCLLLKKGDVIPVGEVERLTGRVRGTDEFNVARLSLMDFIRRERRKVGLFATLTVLKAGGGIRVLQSNQAAAYNQNRMRKTIRDAVKIHKSMKTDVEKAELSETELSEYEHNLACQSKYVQGIRETKKTIKLIPATYDLPSLKTTGLANG